MSSIRYPLILTVCASCSISLVCAADDNTNDSSKPDTTAEITSKVSLVHLGSIDTFTITVEGTLGGRYLLSALDSKDISFAK